MASTTITLLPRAVYTGTLVSEPLDVSSFTTLALNLYAAPVRADQTTATVRTSLEASRDGSLWYPVASRDLSKSFVVGVNTWNLSLYPYPMLLAYAWIRVRVSVDNATPNTPTPITLCVDGAAI